MSTKTSEDKRQPDKAEILSGIESGKFLDLTELDVVNCGLSALPDAVGSLVQLRTLKASQNNLTDLPACMDALQQLRVAFFLGNKFQTVPSVLGKLSSLFMLSFKSNLLTSIPADSLSPSLGWLILTDNRLTTLPSSIGNCKPLRKLMLSCNRLTELPVELGQCTELELVRLADNQLTSVPDWLLALPKLAWLALSSNPFVKPPALGVQHIDASQLSIDASVPPLGEGASGIVRRAVWTRNHSVSSSTANQIPLSPSSSVSNEVPGATPSTVSEPVAVKVFRSGKTSDGDPLDEIAATIGATTTRHQAFISCYGRAELISAAPTSTVAAAAASSASASAGAPAVPAPPVLVFELLQDWSALAGPPSFDSVTRDVYPDALQISLPLLLEVASNIAGACASLHAIGLCHGDLYSHNLLVPAWLTRGDDFRAERHDPRVSLLSDFGAAFYYDTASSSAPLIQRVEVRAFGILLRELMALVKRDEDRNAAVESSTLLALNQLAEDCMQPNVSVRPDMANVASRLAGLRV